MWREAEVELQRSNASDFDDLLTYAVRLLAEHPHRLAFYRQRWRWLVVDEYQDTNEAQSVLVALLAGAGGNVCCVGDDDQLLYRCRGGGAAEHARVRRAVPGARADRARPQLPLAARRSSRPPSRASRTTSSGRPKALIATRGAGGEVRVIAYGSDRHEADSVAARDRAGTRPAASPPARCSCSPAPATPPGRCRRALARAGIPHRVLGSLGLYERSEVRDALAYLTLLANPADAQAFRRAVGSPKRGVGSRDRQPRGHARPRNAPRRPDRARARTRTAIDGIRAAGGSRPAHADSAKDSSTSEASCAPAGRSVTSSSPR